MSEELKQRRAEAEAFCAANLRECAAELIGWQNTALLRDGKVRELAALCGEYVGGYDGLKVAERMIQNQACERIATPSTSPASDAELPTFDAVWDAIDWDKWRSEPIRELVRHIHTLTTPAARAASTRTASEPAWGAVHAVGDMVRNLLTLDQDSPIYAAFHVDYQGERRCRTRPVSISRERVIDGKWVDSARTDVPYNVIVWAKQDERTTADTSTDAATRSRAEGGNTQPESPAEVDVEAERPRFEAWAESEKYNIERNNDLSGAPYAGTGTRLAWSGWLAARTQADAGKERELYNELLFAVARKFPGESRHETALRYIREAELPSTEAAKAATTKPENP